MSNNHFRNLPVPFLSQRQNDYLWYKRDKDNFVIANQTPVSMDCRTCNITSVMMVMKYLGLTGIERTVKNITFTTPSTPKEFLTKYFNHEYDSIFTVKPTYGVDCLEDWNNLKKIASDIFGANCTYDNPDSKTISLKNVKLEQDITINKDEIETEIEFDFDIEKVLDEEFDGEIEIFCRIIYEEKDIASKQKTTLIVRTQGAKR